MGNFFKGFIVSVLFFLSLLFISCFIPLGLIELAIISVSFLCGVIIYYAYKIIEYINKLREEVYQVKRQNEIFESKYFKQFKSEENNMEN